MRATPAAVASISPALSRLITPTLDLPAADAVLGRLASGGPAAGDPAAALQSRPARLPRPQGPPRHDPRPQPAGLRDRCNLPPGPVLKLGMRDPRVPLIRSHFGLETRTAGTLDAAPGEPGGLRRRASPPRSPHSSSSAACPPTGTLTAQTVVAWPCPRPRRAAVRDEAALIVNMERWRWLPSDLGPDYVMVNIPEFRLRVVRDGRSRDEARVIVGKTESPTPIFSGLMEYAVVNPSWNVPPSILKNEFLPGARPRSGLRGAARLSRSSYRNGKRFGPPAAGRAQCARLHQVHVPQQPCGLPARHAEPVVVLGRPTAR